MAYYNKHKDLPVDAIWVGREYMKSKMVFNGIEPSFDGIADAMKQLKTTNVHTIITLDPSISKESKAYQIGNELNTFIKNPYNGNNSFGIGYGGYSSYVDFFHPNSTKYMKQMMLQLKEQFDFGGLYLDLNEIYNLCDGDCYYQPNPHISLSGYSFYDDMSYLPSHRNLQKNTISLDALHYGDPGNMTQFNVHSMNGYLQSK